MWEIPSQQYNYTGYISPNQYQNFPTSHNVTSSVPLDSLDWPFLDNIDPALCSSKEYRHILKEISRTFVRTTIINLGSPERMIKLLRILQIIITTLSSKCDKLTDENEDLRNKYKILHKKYENSSNKPSKVLNVIADRCPICQNSFKTLQHLDLHVFSKHTEVGTLWQAIRTPQPPGAFAFPWQKAHSITSTVYPQSTQNYNDQSVQNLLEDFRKKFVVEQKESEKQMQEWIDKKMSKVESKIDTLQQTAKKEIINTKIDLDDQIQKKEYHRHRSNHRNRKSNRHDKHQKTHQNSFDTSHPFNPINDHKNSPGQGQIKQQTAHKEKPQIVQVQQPQKVTPKPKDDITVQPEKFNESNSNHSVSNNDIKIDQKPSQNSVSGSIVSLEQTSNINFISPQPKSVASGSDAEYESAPADYEDFNDSQGQFPGQITVSQPSQNVPVSKVEDFNGSQKSNSFNSGSRNSELNGSQNSELNRIGQISGEIHNSEDYRSHNSDSFGRPSHVSKPSHETVTSIVTPKKTGGNQNHTQNYPPKIESDADHSFNDDYDEGEIIGLPQQPSKTSPTAGGVGGNFVYDEYNESGDEEGEIVDDGNFVTSYVQPTDKGENYDDEGENDIFVKSDSYSGQQMIPNVGGGEFDDESDNYTKQLDKLNAIDLSRATPPQGKNLIRHSSSAEERIDQPQPQHNHPQDIDYEYYYSEDNENHFDNNKDLINKTNDDTGEYLEKIDNIDDFRSFEDEEPGGKMRYSTRDDGLIGSSFNIDSLPQPDLPGFSDSESAKKPNLAKKMSGSIKDKKSTNKPSEKFRKETYHRSPYQQEDLTQIVNELIQSE